MSKAWRLSIGTPAGTWCRIVVVLSATVGGNRLAPVEAAVVQTELHERQEFGRAALRGQFSGSKADTSGWGM